MIAVTPLAGMWIEINHVLNSSGLGRKNHSLAGAVIKTESTKDEHA